MNKEIKKTESLLSFRFIVFQMSRVTTVYLTELGKKREEGEASRDSKVTTKAMTEILRTNWKKEGNKAAVWGLAAEDSKWWQEDVGRRKVTCTGTTDMGVVLSFPLSWSSLLYEDLMIHWWSLSQYPMVMWALRWGPEIFSAPLFTILSAICRPSATSVCPLPSPFVFSKPYTDFSVRLPQNLKCFIAS